MNRDTLALLAMLLSAVGFGLSPLGAKLAYQAGSDAGSVSVIRYGFNFIALAALGLALRRQLVLPRREAAVALFLGLLLGVETIAYLTAIDLVPVSIAVIVFFTFPMQIAAASAIFGGDRITALRALCILAGFAGVALSVAPDRVSLNVLGLVLSLLSGTAVATITLLSAPLTRRVEPIAVGAHMAFGAFATALVYCAGYSGFAVPGTALGWLGIAITSLGFTTALLLYLLNVGHLGPVKTGILYNLEPVTAVLSAVVFLGESLRVEQIAGAAAILSAVVILQLFDRNPGNPQPGTTDSPGV